MSFNTAASWIKFFDAAGVPKAAAASYAHTFVENRIQMDMLMDLNKEYLREMGINPMGDIINILRHARTVHDQYTRDKVMKASEQPKSVPMAKVAASPVASNIVKLNSSGASSSASSSKPVQSVVSVAPKPRRVLPEHEGKYKITLPSGTTPRSKDILAKKMAMDQRKQGVFDRLSGGNVDDVEMMDDDSLGSGAVQPVVNQKIRITGVGSQQVNSSVFARLGGKAGDDGDGDARKTSPGILKKSPSTVTVKKRLVGNELVSIKKVPAKAATMVADEMERLPSIGQRLVFASSASYMDQDEAPGKSVKFSAEDEVVEIDTRRVLVKPKLKINSIRQRLGAKQPANGKASVLASLHATKKTIKLKSGGGVAARLGGSTNKVKLLRYGALRSEDLLQQTVPSPSVHSRLDFHKKAELLANRIGKVSLDHHSGKGVSGGGAAAGGALKKKSVFNRLGFGK